ncbi:MAG: SUMF1/EgtB/PvdO family nonheme iron enzyme [Verrucomicrobiota bacterium]
MKKIIIFNLLFVIVVWTSDPPVLAAEGEAASKPAAAEIHLAVLVDLKPRLDAYLKLRNEQLGALAAKYGRVLDSQLNKAADAGDLKTVEAFRGEKDRLQMLGETLQAVPKDSVGAVSTGADLPDLAAGSPAALSNLRKIWISEQVKVMQKVDVLLQKSLKSLEANLTKKRDFDNAKVILTYRESLASANPTPVFAAVKKAGVVETVKAGSLSDGAIKVATKEKPFVNSLKMRFVPVKITGGPARGRTVLFSVWETRKEDYEAFIRKNRDRVWPELPFEQDRYAPAVNVSWDDAQAFCKWLTKKERESGKIGKKEMYRLPYDHEWSDAVGIGKMEDGDATPFSKDRRIGDEFPWGKGFPPKSDAGNYKGQESEAAGAKLPHDDGYARTSPAGSFKVNKLGLYDLGGNVSELCQDLLKPEVANEYVMRGSNYGWGLADALSSSRRGGFRQDRVGQVIGFRVVIVREKGMK